jgi:hypothetical protein
VYLIPFQIDFFSHILVENFWGLFVCMLYLILTLFSNDFSLISDIIEINRCKPSKRAILFSMKPYNCIFEISPQTIHLNHRVSISEENKEMSCCHWLKYDPRLNNLYFVCKINMATHSLSSCVL